MNTSLFESCYENYLDFDLKSFHEKESKPSKFHTLNGEFLSIEDLEIQDLNFSDEFSKNFNFINYNGKNYLIGDHSCYPCSIVYINKNGYKWVNLLWIPNGNEIFFNQKGNVIQYLFLSLLPIYQEIKSYGLIDDFLNKYRKSFGKNEWYDKEQEIQIIKRSSLNSDEKFNLLYNKKYLNPFQLAVSSCLASFQISNDDLYHSLLINNDIYLGINYVVSPTYKVKFSKSTNSLIKKEIFREYIFSLDSSEINLFFEVEFLRNNILLDLNDVNLILDLLSIDDLIRHQENDLGIPPWKYKVLNMEKAGITKNFIKKYYQRLSSNLRTIENIVRLKKGYNLVGSLYNETLLFQNIVERFPNLTISSQFSPEWLGRQKFDIYIHEYNLAIEYNGKQHYEPIDFYGGEEGFWNNLKRDEMKRKKCLKNHCIMIEVKYDEDFDICLNRIENIINEKTKT